MKKVLFSILIVFSTATIFASETNSTATIKKKRTPEEIRARAESYMMRRHGGYIRKSGSAQGKVVFVNAQKQVPTSALKSAFDEIDHNVHPDWYVKEVESINLTNPRADISKLGGTIGVVIAESKDLPALITAPEDGWSIINVTALASDSPSADKLASRTRKQLLRAFALTGGCSFMARGPIVLRSTIRTPMDLDSIPEESYGVDALISLEQRLPEYGVMPWIQTTYRKACKEGWAPAPTNKFQKAIWEKTRGNKERGPSNGIKILPPNKK